MNKLVLTALCLIAAGCQPVDKSRSHGDGNAHAHTPNGGHTASGGHAHGDLENTAVTLWDEHLELFAEYPPFIKGKPEALITHLTRLSDWSPRESGEISITLSTQGQPAIEMRDAAPARSGIYLPNLQFPTAGTWRITLNVPHEQGSSTFEIDNVKVHASKHDAEHAARPHVEDDHTAFLKEQQWRIDFATEAVGIRLFRETLTANGSITARAGGQVQIHTPIHGRISPETETLFMGQTVKRGQRLTQLIPFLEELDDPITLREAVSRVTLEYELAVKELARSKRLIREKVVPEDDMDHRLLEVQTKKNEMEAAKRRLALLEDSNAETASVPLYAPISGVITDTDVAPGALFEEGEPLYEITDLSRVQLEVHIPESQVGLVRNSDGAVFQIEGVDRVFEVGPQTGGRRIALAGKVDPLRRTVPLLFEVPNPDEALRIGMFTRVAVMTGKSATGVAIPSSALVEEAGMAIAYVQKEGEAFERRPVRLGIRDGAYTQVLAGLQAGERVVTRGAYQVRLAANTSETPDHGHTH